MKVESYVTEAHLFLRESVAARPEEPITAIDLRIESDGTRVIALHFPRDFDVTAWFAALARRFA